MERNEHGQIRATGWQCNHPRTPENTWRKKYKRGGDRVVYYDACRTCQRERMARWRADPTNKARDNLGKQLRKEGRFKSSEGRKKVLTRIFGRAKQLSTDTQETPNGRR